MYGYTVWDEYFFMSEHLTHLLNPKVALRESKGDSHLLQITLVITL
jgi:hypothetical protein